MWSSDEHVSTDDENGPASPEATLATEVWDQAYSRIRETNPTSVLRYESILWKEMGQSNQWRISTIGFIKATTDPDEKPFRKLDAHARRRQFEVCLEYLIKNHGGVELDTGSIFSFTRLVADTEVTDGGCPTPCSYLGSFQEIIEGLRAEAESQPHAMHAWTAASCAVLMVSSSLLAYI